MLTDVKAELELYELN